MTPLEAATATLPAFTQTLVKNSRDGACAWWDGYAITATCTRVGSVERTAFENGWKKARDEAIRQGLAVEGADNTQHQGSR